MSYSERPAMVLLSGGQDSATCALWAKAFFSEVHGISFNYGQRHVKELVYAKRVATKLKFASHQTINLAGFLKGSALIDHEADINAKHALYPDLPASFTPGRNAVFFSVAAGLAANLGVLDLITGICQTDYSGYPDCRESFRVRIEEALSLALDRPKFHIIAPLMFLSKAETWGLAREMGQHLGMDGVGFIRENTLTDYNGDETLNDWGRGQLDNPASILRKKGYDEAIESGLI